VTLVCAEPPREAPKAPPEGLLGLTTHALPRECAPWSSDDGMPTWSTDDGVLTHSEVSGMASVHIVATQPLNRVLVGLQNFWDDLCKAELLAFVTLELALSLWVTA